MKDIPRISKPPTSGKAGELISRDVDLMSRSYRRAFPLVIKRVEGAVVEDVNGNSYIDFTSGLGFLPLGGNHPEIVKAIRDQLNESSSYNPAAAYHEKPLELAEELSRIVPIRGDVRFIFCDSGGEAIDLAIKAVKWHSGRRAILSFIGEYHGSVGESLTASTDLRSRRLLARISDMLYFPALNCENCPLGLSSERCGAECVEEMRSHVEAVAPNDLAGIVFNPLGLGRGVLARSEKYISRLLGVMKDLRALAIADEVLTAPARTGRWFALDRWNVKVDLVCLGSPLASGLPIGVIAAREEVLDLELGMHDQSGGNLLSIASAIATLRVIRDEGLVERSERIGRRILGRLRDLIEDLELGWRARGVGMLLGLEVAGERAEENARMLINELFRIGLLVWRMGSTILLTPPLNIEENLLDRGLELLEEKIREFSRLSQAS